MSERKVLNKYYPPDFDPSKIPRMKLPKNRQYTVRLMAPFNMRCATCGEYIYKGKKFNARKEDVENEDYLGIRIYRFYIKCTRCLQEISFKTDPKNTDYEIEAGATRNFMALKLAEEQAQREEEEAKEEEASNPMKLLENRTKQSKNEIELLESLEELKDLNRRQQVVDYETMLMSYDDSISEREREEKLQQLDEDYIKSVKFESNRKRKLVVEEEIIEEVSDPKLESPSGGSTTSEVHLISSQKITKSENNNKVFASVGWSKDKNLSKVEPKRNKSLMSLVKVKTDKKNEQFVDIEKSKSCDAQSKSFSKENTENITKPSVSGLLLLGSYSDSDEGDNSQ